MVGSVVMAQSMAFCFMAARNVWPAPTPRRVLLARSTPALVVRNWVRKSVDEPLTVVPSDLTDGSLLVVNHRSVVLTGRPAGRW